MSQLRARQIISWNISDAVSLPGMRTFVFSRTGVLRRRDDYQLRRYNGLRCGNFSGVLILSRFHDLFDQHENPALDDVRDRLVAVAGAALLQFLAGSRLLDKAASSGGARQGKGLAHSPDRNATPLLVPNSL